MGDRSSMLLVMSDEAKCLASNDRHMGYAKYLARLAAERMPIEYADAESAAIFGLCHAAMTYDPAFGVPFPKWARRRIMGRILDDVRNARFGGEKGKGLSLLSIEFFVPDDDDVKPFRPMWEVIPSGECPGESIYDATEAMACLFRELPQPHRRAMELLYLNAATARKRRVAEAMGLSEGRIAQIHDEAIGKIRSRRLAERMMGVTA